MTLKPYKKLLITDVDNTLFDWFSIWYYPFKALIENVLDITKLDKTDLLSEIRQVHKRHGTSEYSFLLTELPSLLKVYGDTSTIRSNLDRAISAYQLERMSRLKLYDSVQETLVQIKERGTTIVAYTESKAWHSKFRFKALGLDKLIDTLYSPPDHTVPLGEKDKQNIELYLTQVRHTPPNELKPNPKLLEDIITEKGFKKSESCYIGDSRLKDIEMAHFANVDHVYAKYGNQHFDKEDTRYELLRKVSHWSDKDIEREKQIIAGDHHIEPTRVANQFSDLLKFFEFGS